MKRHLGFTTFTITLLLILILLGVSLLVAKLIVTDRRVSLNEVQYRQALALAEQGLADGMGRLAQNASWRTSNSGESVPATTGRYLLTVLDAPAITVNTIVVTPVVVRAQATLDNSTASATAELKAVKKAVLADTPAAPLTIAGGMAAGGNSTVAANPNGGGPGVPLSVWSDKPVIGGSSWQTCHQQDYPCGKNTSISNASVKGADLKDNDPNFPPDLLWYLFNEHDDATGWSNLESRANQIVENCNALGPATTGLVIVKGNCIAGSNIGTQAAPVILVIKDGDLTANGNNQLYGMVFAYSSTPATASTDIKLNGGAIVNGVIVANYQLGKFNGTFDAKYDPDVLNNIKNGSAFQRMKMIPGSWRDW